MAETRASCERCGAPTVEIGLLKSSAQLLLRSCSNCDHRIWLQEGRPAPMEAVLAAVSTSGRRRSA